VIQRLIGWMRGSWRVQGLGLGTGSLLG